MNPFTARIFRLALVLGAVVALPGHAQEAGEAQNSIQALNVTTAAGGKLVLTITMKRPLVGLPRAFAVSTPPRIALDFPDTVNDLGKPTQEFNQGGLRSVSIVQAGSRSRMVINLTQPLPYDARIEGNSLLVTLSSPSQGGTTSRFAESAPGTPGHTVRDIDFHRGANGEGRIEVALSDAGTGIDIRHEGKKVVVDFMKTSAPRALQRKLDVTDFGTPVSFIDTFAQGANVRMVVEPTGQWEQVAYQTDEKFVLEIKRKVEEPQKKGEKPVYSGEKLTLNFQNIQVREALNVIADFTGLNIVISDSVSGNLTLRLKDVPWDQALDIILQSKGLDMRKSGNVIQVAPREEIAAREKLQLTAQQDIVDLEPLRTESFLLSYQKGEDLVMLLAASGTQRILSKRGSAVVDKRTNTLFVQDTPSRLEDVRALIKQIDVPVRQVLIEARFVSAGSQFSRSLGTKLNFVNFGAVNSPLGPLGQTGFMGANAAPVGVTKGNQTIPQIIQNNFTTTPNALSVSMFDPGMTRLLQLEIDASEIDGTTKNIASPRVVTADKAPATITSGTQIPYQQATSSGATSIAFIDAALTLTVTPLITPDDNIDMKLIVNQNTVGPPVAVGVGTAPSVNMKKVTTQVLVQNGGTVVIGGVYTQDVTDSANKIPLLGDIPIIGWLFKNKITSDNKNELLIFITPKILKDNLNLD